MTASAPSFVVRGRYRWSTGEPVHIWRNCGL